MGATTSSRMPHWSPEDVKATLNKFRTPQEEEGGGLMCSTAQLISSNILQILRSYINYSLIPGRCIKTPSRKLYCSAILSKDGMRLPTLVPAVTWLRYGDWEPYSI
jgi:hypothetical protein